MQRAAEINVASLCSELHQPATTFRQAVVEAVHAQEVETPEDTPEADHPAYKYQVHALAS